MQDLEKLKEVQMGDKLKNMRESFANSVFRLREDPKKERTELSLSYCGYEKCEPGHRFGPNMREDYVLHIVRDGKGFLEIGDKKYEIGKNEIFLIPIKEEVWYEADLQDPWTYMWVAFTGRKAEECLSCVGLSMENPVQKVTCTEKLCDLIFDMIKSNQLSLEDELKRNGLLMLFFSCLIYDYTKQMPEGMLSRDCPSSEYVRYAVEYIVNNYNKRIRIGELADEIGVNRSYLSLNFKKEIGCSPQEFLINKRMEKAEYMLAKTNIPIGEVAYLVGYQDQLAFSKVFKHFFGMSPKAYRIQEKSVLNADKIEV